MIFIRDHRSLVPQDHVSPLALNQIISVMGEAARVDKSVVLQGLYRHRLAKHHFISSCMVQQAKVDCIRAVVLVQGESLMPSIVCDAKGEEGFGIRVFEGEVFEVQRVILVEGSLDDGVDDADVFGGKGVGCSVFMHAVFAVGLRVADGFEVVLLLGVVVGDEGLGGDHEEAVRDVLPQMLRDECDEVVELFTVLIGHGYYLIINNELLKNSYIGISGQFYWLKVIVSYANYKGKEWWE